MMICKIDELSKCLYNKKPLEKTATHYNIYIDKAMKMFSKMKSQKSDRNPTIDIYVPVICKK